MTTETQTTEVNKNPVVKIREISFTGIMPWKDVQLVNGGISRVTAWREEMAGRFPKRVKISLGRVGWVGPEMKKHVESRPRVNPGECEIENGETEKK